MEYCTDYPIPSLQAGQILVKNTISGINYIDTYFREGLYPSMKPEALGREAAGTIAALGPGTEACVLDIGDRVIWVGTGGYAEYTAVSAAKTMKLRPGISDEGARLAISVG